MSRKSKVAALCGSNRRDSVNLRLIHIIAGLLRTEIDFDILSEINELPHFNSDLYDNPPEKVNCFRKKMRSASGVLICTPEYAMGVPGCLKNAIDWTVSSMEFSGMPVALITAASQGQKCHASLLETLKIIEADVRPELQLIIPSAKTKINNNAISDLSTLKNVLGIMSSLIIIMKENEAKLSNNFPAIE